MPRGKAIIGTSGGAAAAPITMLARRLDAPATQLRLGQHPGPAVEQLQHLGPGLDLRIER